MILQGGLVCLFEIQINAKNWIVHHQATKDILMWLNVIFWDILMWLNLIFWDILMWCAAATD